MRKMFVQHLYKRCVSHLLCYLHFSHKVWMTCESLIDREVEIGSLPSSPCTHGQLKLTPKPMFMFSYELNEALASC